MSSCSSYPVDWVNELLGQCHVLETEFYSYDAEGEFHADGRPAVVILDLGVGEAWFHHGERHREDGPAVTKTLHKYGLIGQNYLEERWYWFGKLHRDDGPAVSDSDGNKEWWLDGMLLEKTGPASEDDAEVLGDLFDLYFQ
jgi:hypothetical protein